MMAVSFSTGFCANWKISKAEAVKVLKRIKGLDGVELMFYTPLEFDEFIGSFSDYSFLKKLGANSIHIPVNDIQYKNTPPIVNFLENILMLFEKINAKRIIVHSDVVQDFSVFKQFKARFCIENLSPRKTSPFCQSPKEALDLLAEHPSFGFCLDTCHAMSNGFKPHDFFVLRQSIDQIHVSSARGLGLEQSHTPLVLAGLENANLIRPVFSLQKPIVIESIIPAKDELLLQKELDFVHALANTGKP